jgi:sugar O-acyltransferase (sialic acid O-acetyltransferase NeuD family)
VKLLIAGAGGHGRVVADAAEGDARWTEIAFLDDRYPELSRSGAWEVVGTVHDLARFFGAFDACLAAVGDARLRLNLIERAHAAGYTVPVIRHPKAAISRHSRLQPGSVIAAAGVVNIGSQIGIGCIVNSGATVDHDCRLGDGVHICPGAHLAGSVEIGARTWFGIGAVARQGLQIGADVTVGAGAVCLDNVRDGAFVAGVPAREIPR